MTQARDPYDELPYRSLPIEWTAPERLAVTSLLHGGPRAPLDRYRMLELGCGEGTNLVALAYYRRHAEFVGVDGSRRHIELARARARKLGLDNLRFFHADLRTVDAQLEGRFEYIVAHGVLSWVPDDVRDALLQLHHRCLAPSGLYYISYNAQPGWSIRGLVRQFLLAQTEGAGDLLARSHASQAVAARLAAMLKTSEHAYSQLMAAEFRMVEEAETTYLAHEYLIADNRAYWRSEFRALAQIHGLDVVGDADFDHSGGRDDTSLDAWLVAEGIHGRAFEDTSDLLRFRQMHSPILTAPPWVRRPPDVDEIGALFVASSLVPASDDPQLPAQFRHPGGQDVEVTVEPMRAGLGALRSCWPRGLRVRDVFADVAAAVDDLLLLHRFGLLDLRYVEPEDFAPGDATNRLNALEAEERDDVTNAYHRRLAVKRSEDETPPQ